MAARRELSDSKLRQYREEQLKEICEVASYLEKEVSKYREFQRTCTSLESVSLGIYDELDKLTKKAPVEQITELMLEQVNDLIRETKQLAEEDPYIQKLAEFVPAGDLPQQRDVLFVVRQIREGLKRFDKNLDEKRGKFIHSLREASVIQAALSLFLEGKFEINEKELKKEADVGIEGIPSKWLTSNYPTEFDFSRLDTIHIKKYFSLS